MNLTKQKYHNVLHQTFGKTWAAYNGDSTLVLQNLPDNSIDLWVGSPPFIELFTYTATERDLGNSRSREIFNEHYKLIVEQKLRITKPGRVACVHTQNVPAMKERDGWMGLKDFPGDVIRLHENAGWIWWGDIHINKNPQALKNGTRVLTPKGFLAIENLNTGDFVIGSDGHKTKVLGVYPHETRQMYELEFSNGEKIECDGQHLWTVKSETSVWKTLKTQDIYQDYLYKNGSPKFRVPRMQSVAFEKQEKLMIHPYTLGVLIGDGHLSTRGYVSVTTQKEIVKKLELPDGCNLRMQPKTEKDNGLVATFGITHEKWHENPLIDALRYYKIKGLRAWEKFIPQQYLLSSKENRIELLRGLMDSDGTIKKNNSSIYTTTSQKLAKDVMFLVRSLGGFATLRIEKKPKYKHNGKEKTGRVRYSICVRLDKPIFKMQKKLKRWKKSKRTRRMKIVSVKKTLKSKCTCITIENENGLFVTEGFILTHNSQAIRTKTHALMFKTLKKDSAKIRPAIGDRVLVFKKPGDNKTPVTPVQNGEMDNEKWIEWADPIWRVNLENENALSSPIEAYWFDINESSTLQHKDHGRFYEGARSEKDVKHMCALQLDTIERCIIMYSNPGEIVADEFAGIFSTPYVANINNRCSVGIELKPEWYERGVQNMKISDSEKKQINLFDVLEQRS
jgi:DNA modification methylase